MYFWRRWGKPMWPRRRAIFERSVPDYGADGEAAKFVRLTPLLAASAGTLVRLHFTVTYLGALRFVWPAFPQRRKGDMPDQAPLRVDYEIFVVAGLLHQRDRLLDRVLGEAVKDLGEHGVADGRSWVLGIGIRLD